MCFWQTESSSDTVLQCEMFRFFDTSFEASVSNVTSLGGTLIELSLSLQAGMNLRKVNRHVDFPLLIDLAPFCSATCKVLIIHISKDQ